MKQSAGDSPRICDYEGSTYRTDFWEGRGREYEDAVERVALNRLLPSRGRRLLDVGAGFGRLASLYDGYDEVVLLDYSVSQLQHARCMLGDERFVYVAADLYRLPLADAACDTAVMVRVLHHLADVPAALAQLRRAIGPGGLLVMEFANKRHIKNILRHLLGRGPNPFDPAPYAIADLHYDYHPSWVLIRLAEAGLAPEERLSVSLFRQPLLKRLLPLEALVAIDRLLQRPTAALALAPSVFVRSRAPGASGAPLVSRAQLFICPACTSPDLRPAPDTLVCRGCGATWPIQDGVYVFK